MEQPRSLERVLPVTYGVNRQGHMEIGGCDLVELAHSYGTPLYVYDEDTLRQRCREFMAAMDGRGDVLYSAKAFAAPAVLRLIAEEGLGLDVVSEGELHLALRSGFPGSRAHFLGNNKSRSDIDAACRAGAVLVIDGWHDFDLIRELVSPPDRARCVVRLSPGVIAGTHEFISTGQLDSKFGFPVATGAARRAVETALAEDRLDLIGLHSHLGSQILDLRGHRAVLEILLDLTLELTRDLGWWPACLGAGGGLGIAYRRDDLPPTPRQFVALLLETLESGCERRQLQVPRLVVEPGRSIAGPAGVAVYTVGAIKDIPGLRRYVSVDGGMGDNIRPKLYGARYEAVLASAPEREPEQTVTIAGKYCESTDILVEEVQLPELAPGDILCVPAAGAYCLAMASNYNGIPRPAAVMARAGRSRLIQRRESLDEMLLREVF